MRGGSHAIIITALIGCGGSSTTPLPDRVRRTTTDQTAALLERWVSADRKVFDSIVGEHAIVVDSDPNTGAIVFGKQAITTLPSSNRCSLGLAIVNGADAAVVRHCIGVLPAKQPPTERSVSLFRMNELHFDRAGKLAISTLWFDNLRTLQQVGVDVGADARPDAATPTVIIRARRDQTEAANEVAARALIAALDRRDFAAAARAVADGYSQHDLSSAEPAVFGTSAQYEQAIRAELEPCEASTVRVLSTIAAGDWVAVRYGQGCRLPTLDSYTAKLWLMRFSSGRLVESWRAPNRTDELIQLGQLHRGKLAAKIAAAGL